MMMVARNDGRTIILASKDVSKVLGFDVSSQTVGWGLISLDNFNNLLAYGHIRPLSSKHELMERLDDLFIRIEDLCKQLSPNLISIEDISLFFKSGFSTAKTITTLATFNRVVALAAYRATRNVKFYPVSTVRKIIKKTAKLKGTPKKDEIPKIIRNSLESNYSDVKKRNGETAIQTFDEADGIAVAWACAKDKK